VENLRSQPHKAKFEQKLRAKAKFAKNYDFARKGQICAKIAPRKTAIFFRDCTTSGKSHTGT